MNTFTQVIQELPFFGLSLRDTEIADFIEFCTPEDFLP
jgi:hypothetical protein